MTLHVATKRVDGKVPTLWCYCGDDLFDDLCWHSVMTSAEEGLYQSFSNSYLVQLLSYDGG